MSQTETRHTETASATEVKFEGGNPIFRVQSVAASIDYYTRVRGFKLQWSAPVGFACVSRDRFHLFLCEGDQGHFGTWVWVGVTDAGALHEQYRAAGARVRHPPTNYYWAYEMQVEDLDGNVLRMGSEPIAGQPFGEWLDMDGVAWPPASEAG